LGRKENGVEEERNPTFKNSRQENKSGLTKLLAGGDLGESGENLCSRHEKKYLRGRKKVVAFELRQRNRKERTPAVAKELCSQSLREASGMRQRQTEGKETIGNEGRGGDEPLATLRQKKKKKKAFTLQMKGKVVVPPWSVVLLERRNEAGEGRGGEGKGWIPASGKERELL